MFFDLDDQMKEQLAGSEIELLPGKTGRSSPTSFLGRGVAEASGWGKEILFWQLAALPKPGKGWQTICA
jgi:hypothetical protein